MHVNLSPSWRWWRGPGTFTPFWSSLRRNNRSAELFRAERLTIRTCMNNAQLTVNLRWRVLAAAAVKRAMLEVLSRGESVMLGWRVLQDPVQPQRPHIICALCGLHAASSSCLCLSKAPAIILFANNIWAAASIGDLLIFFKVMCTSLCDVRQHD